jgi:hypothetical protein
MPIVLIEDGFLYPGCTSDEGQCANCDYDMSHFAESLHAECLNAGCHYA